MKDEQHRLLKSKNRLSRHRNPHTTVIQGNPIYDLIDTDKVPQDLEDYQICLKDSIHRSHGQPINVTHVKTFGSILNSSSNNLSSESTILSHSEPIKFVYYTECDQVVYFDDEITFDVLSAASNESTFFSGRRKEKSRDSNPEEYMSTLNNWRECGAPGYSIQWPMQNYVQID